MLNWEEITGNRFVFLLAAKVSAEFKVWLFPSDTVQKLETN